MRSLLIALVLLSHPAYASIIECDPDTVCNGTTGDDSMVDASGNETINPLAGNDNIEIGNGGTDILNLTAGADLVNQTDGTLTINCDSGMDQVANIGVLGSVETTVNCSGVAVDVIMGVSDSLFVNHGPVTANFGSGDDSYGGARSVESTVVSADGADTLTGAPFLFGQTTAEQDLDAGSGNDTVFASNFQDAIQLGSGNDTAVSSAFLGDHIVDTGTGDNLLRMLNGKMIITSGTGAQTYEALLAAFNQQSEIFNFNGDSVFDLTGIDNANYQTLLDAIEIIEQNQLQTKVIKKRHTRAEIDEALGLERRAPFRNERELVQKMRIVEGSPRPRSMSMRDLKEYRKKGRVKVADRRVLVDGKNYGSLKEFRNAVIERRIASKGLFISSANADPMDGDLAIIDLLVKGGEQLLIDGTIDEDSFIFP